MPEERRVGGRYLLRRQIAVGGMGTVWLARDETLRRDVAVKVLHLQHGVSEADREQAVGRALREARIAARLHHPNAVQVYDVVDDDGRPSLVMQYVPSRSLAAVVAEDGPLPPHQVARIGTQVAAALAAAHRVGIVHRDVKPGNVLIADDGIVRITDFGVSHAFDDVTVTATGMLTGTPAFLAPEAARGVDATAASDVFSLGSTLFFAVEGRTPFGDDGNAMAVLHRVASARPEPMQRAGALTAMLQAMMAPAPADRPAMVAIAARLPELHPLTSDGSEPHDALTQRLRPVLAPAATAVAAWHASAMTAARAPASAPAGHDVRPQRPGSTSRGPQNRGLRNRAWLPVAAVVAVVAIVVVLAVVLLRNASTGGRSTNAGATSSLVPDTTISPPPQSSPASATQRATDTPTTPTAATPTAGASAAGAPSASELTTALVSYFRLIPGDLDSGWSLLTPSFQQGRAGGRASYDDYWATVRRVDVRDARGDSPRTVKAKLVYHYDDGRTVSQQTTFRLVRDGGVLKIDGQS